MSARDRLDEIQQRAQKQADAYSRMLEIGEGVGGLGVRHPEMFEDILDWSNSTDNEHADTVLALVGALRAVLDLTQNVGNESTGPAYVACYEVRGAITDALGGEQA